MIDTLPLRAYLNLDNKEIEYTIRLYESGDEESIVKLLIKVFGQFPRFDIECSPVDHWRWKFIDNPANVRAHALDMLPHAVAIHEGEVIGVTHGMYFYNKVGEALCLCHKGVDVAVDDNFRGMGIYTKITDLKHTVNKKLGDNFTYSLTANPIIINRTRVEENFIFPRPIKYLIKIGDVEKHFKNAVDEKDPWKKMFLKMGVYGLKTLNKLTNSWAKASQLKDVTFKEVTKFDDRINIFYEKVKPHYYFIVEKTAEYLNWRYCDKRGGNFKTWIAEEAGEIVGFMVLRVNRINPDYPLGYVIDLLALDGRLDIVESFVSFAVGWFDGLSVNVVHTQLIGNHVYEGILGKYGFLDSRVKPHLTYRPWNISAKDLELFRGASPSELHYPYGEGDAI